MIVLIMSSTIFILLPLSQPNLTVKLLTTETDIATTCAEVIATLKVTSSLLPLLMTASATVVDTLVTGNNSPIKG